MKKQIRDYIDYDFHTPNTKEVREFLEDNFDRGDTSQWASDAIYDHITTTCCFTGLFTTNNSYGKHIPTEQFMELIGMTKPSTTRFTKADLKDGMICTTRNGNVCTVAGDRMYSEGGNYLLMDDFNVDLTCVEKLDNLDIIKVVSPVVVFERVDPKQQAIKKELEFAEAKKQRLENHINVLKSKLK